MHTIYISTSLNLTASELSQVAIYSILDFPIDSQVHTSMLDLRGQSRRGLWKKEYLVVNGSLAPSYDVACRAGMEAMQLERLQYE
jgi:hypothetical protein